MDFTTGSYPDLYHYSITEDMEPTEDIEGFDQANTLYSFDYCVGDEVCSVVQLSDEGNRGDCCTDTGVSVTVYLNGEPVDETSGVGFYIFTTNINCM